MKDSAERQKRYHARRRLIQSLDVARREKQILEAIHEAGDQCWESQASIAERKGISPKTVKRAIDDLIARKWIKRTKRGQGKTDLMSIEWRVVQGPELDTSPRTPCPIKSGHHVHSRPDTVSTLDRTPCPLPLVTDERIEEPMTNDGAMGDDSFDEKAEAERLVREFYSHYDRFGRTHHGTKLDVEYVAELIRQHGHEPVSAAVRRMPERLGSNSDRIYLRGCRATLEATVAGQQQIVKRHLAAERTGAELKSQRERWADEDRRSQAAFAWFGDLPPEVQAQIRAKAEAEIPRKYRGNTLFATSYLSDAIQHEMQARGVYLEEFVA